MKSGLLVPLLALSSALVARAVDTAGSPDEFKPFPDLVGTSERNAVFYTEPRLDLGRQTDHVSPHVPPPVPLGPLIVSGEGAAPENTTLVRVFNRYQFKTSQFLAFPPNIKGGVQVAAGKDGKGGTLIATAPISSIDAPMVRIFSPDGFLVREIGHRIEGAVAIATGRFLSGDASAAEVLVVAPAKAEGELSLRLFPMDGSGGRAVSIFLQDVERGKETTVRLSTYPAQPRDLLLVHLPEKNKAFLVDVSDGSVALATSPELAGAQWLGPGVFPGEWLAAGMPGTDRSLLKVFPAGMKPSVVDAGQRESRYWYAGFKEGMPGLKKVESAYVRPAAHSHIRIDTNPVPKGDVIDPSVDDPAYWGYRGSEDIRKMIEKDLPTQYQAAFLNGGWLGDDQLKETDEETGLLAHRIITIDNKNNRPAVSYAPLNNFTQRFFFWRMRSYLRELSTELRSRNIDQLLVGVAPMHEIGSGGDWNPDIIRGFRDQLVKLHGSLAAVNQRYGTNFASESLKDFDAPRDQGRGAWDAKTSEYWRAWMLYNRYTVQLMQVQGFRECALAGFAPEAINAHMIPDAFVFGTDFTGNATPSAGCPIDVILTSGVGFGGTRYGPVHGRRFEWLPGAYSSGQAMIAAGEYGSDTSEDTYRFFYDWMFGNGLAYIHYTHPYWDNGLEYLLKYLGEMAAENRPRPGIAGGTGQSLGVVTEGRTDRLAVVGTAQNRGGLIKSMNAAGDWTGLVYLKPFHAKVRVDPAVEITAPAAQKGQPDFVTLARSAVITATDIHHGDQVEVTARIRAKAGQTARLLIGICQGPRPAAAGDRQTSVMWLDPAVLGRTPEKIASWVSTTLGGFPIKGGSRIIEVSSDKFEEHRFVFSNQLMLDNVQIVIADISAEPGAAELARLQASVQRELVARPAHGFKEGTPHGGGVTFDVLSRDEIVRTPAVLALPPALRLAGARDQLARIVERETAQKQNVVGRLPAAAGDVAASRIVQATDATEFHNALVAASQLVNDPRADEARIKAARDQLNTLRQRINAVKASTAFTSSAGTGSLRVRGGFPTLVAGKTGTALAFEERAGHVELDGTDFPPAPWSLAARIQLPSKVRSGNMISIPDVISISGYWNALNQLAIKVGTADEIGPVKPAQSGDSLDTAHWHEIVVTCDADGNVQAYLDGRPLGGPRKTTFKIEKKQPLRLGGGRAFAIDQLAIWPRVLTADEAKGVAGGTLPAGAAGVWTFDKDTVKLAQ